MADINYSTLLRELITEYSEYRISRAEYLVKRRELLDGIDLEFNGDINADQTYAIEHDITLVPRLGDDDNTLPQK
jgi:hypothetical protein